MPIIRGFALEGLPNRDSIQYLKEYGLPEDLPTILRGTLRYPGFARVVDVMRRIGLLEIATPLSASAWEDVVDRCLELKGLAGGESRRTSIAGLMEASEAKDKLLDEVLETLAGCVHPSRADSTFADFSCSAAYP